jgi:hypothetical protein
MAKKKSNPRTTFTGPKSEKAAAMYSRLLAAEGKKPKVSKDWGPGHSVMSNPSTRIKPAQWAKVKKRYGGKVPQRIRAAIMTRYRKVKNPAPGWFEQCVEAVTASGSVADPRAVCGAQEKKFKNPGKGKPRMITHRLKPGLKLANPIDQAAKRFEETHGRPPEVVIELVDEERYHSVLPAYGRLEWLRILAIDHTEVKLFDFGGAMLCENEQAATRPQLFIEGGDQSVSLKQFGIDGEHEREVLGAALEVAYKTQKDHLGASGGAGERAVHVHPFGSKRGMEDDDPRKKNGSRLPLIIYDVRNKKLHFAGGSYDLPEVGIRG